MNSLSWLLYLAEVSQSLSTALTFYIVGSFIILFSSLFFLFSIEIEAPNFRPLKIWGVSIFVAVLIDVLLPSRDTIYLIAASEMGEEVVKSEAAEKVFNYLDSVLDGLVAEELE